MPANQQRKSDETFSQGGVYSAATTAGWWREQHVKLLTFQAEAIELAGDVGDEALRASAKAEFGDEVGDHAVEGLVIGFHGLGSQHVLPQEPPDGLPLLPLAGTRQEGTERNEDVTSHRSEG